MIIKSFPFLEVLASQGTTIARWKLGIITYLQSAGNGHMMSGRKRKVGVTDVAMASTSPSVAPT